VRFVFLVAVFIFFPDRSHSALVFLKPRRRITEVRGSHVVFGMQLELENLLALGFR
jgi:hypothetical protein